VEKMPYLLIQLCTSRILISIITLNKKAPNP
jgi:hypothetical protein